MAMGAPFSVFGFSDGDGVAAADHVTGTLYLEDREQVERYKVAFQHLCGTALNQRDSLNLVRDYVGKERSAWSNTG